MLTKAASWGAIASGKSDSDTDKDFELGTWNFELYD